jgi:hypothetical protein
VVGRRRLRQEELKECVQPERSTRPKDGGYSSTMLSQDKNTMNRQNKKTSLFDVFKTDLILIIVFIVVILAISIFIDPRKLLDSLINFLLK